MKHNDADQKRTRATYIYTTLLHFYPRTYQGDFAQPMLQTFQDHYRDAIETGGESAWRFWLSVVSDEGQSVVREHAAALRERTLLMKKISFASILIGFLVLFVLLQRVLHAGGLLLPLLEFAIVVGVLALMARLAQAFPRLEAGLSWPLLGLVMGVILGLYVLAQDTTQAFIPVFPQTNDFSTNLPEDLSLISSILLVATVGLIGGYSSGRLRAGIFAGLLASIVTFVVSNAGQALLIVLSWPALQQGILHSALVVDYQQWIHGSHAPDLPHFLEWEMLNDGLLFNLVAYSIALLIVGLFAWIGSVFGVAASQRTGDAPREDVFSNREHGLLPWLLNTPSGLILTIVFICLLSWGIHDQLNLSREQAPYLISLPDLGNSFISLGFALWFLVFMIVLASVFMTTRIHPARPETRDASC